MTIPVAFQGEVMLAGWSQTHNGGAKVTFWLQDDTDLEAFKAMTVAKGKTAGQRLALVAVEIGDDEEPVSPQSQSTPTPAEKLKGGDLARLAGQLCVNPEFQRFAAHMQSGPNYLASSDQFTATNWLREMCGVDSRADLDHDIEAAARFHERVRKPFLEWKGRMG
ncbi:hypothetical protein [Bordetella bronchiseptica]|uniref:hypothetical protein n=1 Tax=Bordetella bronchiseptica TaxID=518 RepID=UPI0005290F09|nr:hypothetical protein [Bordetella bronchiseptica]